MIKGLNFEINSIPANFLWITFAVVFVIFGIVTAVLFYHWREYGMKEEWFPKLEFVYLLVSLILLAVAFSSLVFF